MEKVVVHDGVATSYIVEPVRRDWIDSGLEIVLGTSLEAARVGGDDFALIPGVEIGSLVGTHAVVPAIGVVSEGSGSVTMRSPVRPDAIDETWVYLSDVGGTAEVLARALVWPFYGVRAKGWSTKPRRDADLTIVEGFAGLDQVEAGYSEDLTRAWFVMTSLPVVSHVLVAPRAASASAIALVTERMTAVLQTGQVRRKELTRLLAEELGVERPALARLLRQQRYMLDGSDVDALEALLFRGAGGTKYAISQPIPVFGEIDPNVSEFQGDA